MSKPKCHLNSNVTKNQYDRKTEMSQKTETAQKLQSTVCLDQHFCRVKSTLLHELEEQKFKLPCICKEIFPCKFI